MLKKFYFRAAFNFLMVMGFTGSAFADNPIITQRYTADPNAFIYKDRMYVICSSDEDNNNSYNLINYTLISSDDMVNWTDHNLVFKVRSNTTWGGQAYAPTAITRNGKVYLYFPNGTSGIGVLSADRPEGPYKDMLGKPIIDRSAPNCSVSDIEWFFDPCIFVDSTTSGSQAYLVVGGGKPYGNNFIIVKVNDDMKSYSGIPQKLTTQGSFEGPFLHKYNNKYYISYPTSNGSNIDYVMSDNPMTGWVYKGTVLPNPTLNGKNINLGNNSHESMIEYKGQWYMFYHDRRLSNAVYKRNACVDILKYNTDGTLQKVIVTSEGAPQIKNFNPFDTIQAETIWKQQGIETEFCNEGGVMVTNISDGDYTSLKGVDFKEGAKTFEVRASCATSGGTVEVHLDKPDGARVASCTVSSTTNWQNWKTFSCDVTNCSGIKNVYFVYKGSGEPFRLNWFRFVPEKSGVINTNQKQIQIMQKKNSLVINPLNMKKFLNGTFYDLSGKMVYRQTGKSSSEKLPSNTLFIVKNNHL